MLYRDSDGTEHVFTPGGLGGYQAPPGVHMTLTLDGSEFSLRSKHGLTSVFSSDGRLLRVSEANGNTVTLGYHADGQLASLTDAAGRTVLTVTSAGDKITGLTDLTGRSVAFFYSANDDLIEVVDTSGQSWAYAYDSGHNLIVKFDPLGNEDTYFYDLNDRCVRHVNPLGDAEAFHYRSRGDRAVMTGLRGFDTYFEFGVRGRAVLEVDPVGNTFQSMWDSENNRTMTVDPRGGVVQRTFDDHGNMLSVVNPLNEVITLAYEPIYNQAVTMTDASGHTTTNVYDSKGNLTEALQAVSGEILIHSYEYHAHGLLKFQTDPNGNTSSLSWDPATGALRSYTDPLLQTRQISSDPLGRVVTISDQQNNDLSITWNNRDQVAAGADPFGRSSAMAYNEAGWPTVMTTLNGSSQTEYDAAGRPIAVTDPQGNVTRTEYDAMGNITAQIDAMGNRTTMIYDPIDRRVATINAQGSVWSYGYCAEIGDGCSNCGDQSGSGIYCKIIDPEGNVVQQEQDVLGRVERIVDPFGKESTIVYDEMGRRKSITDALGQTISYEYDTLSRMTAVVEANGART